MHHSAQIGEEMVRDVKLSFKDEYYVCTTYLALELHLF